MITASIATAASVTIVDATKVHYFQGVKML